MEIGKKAPEFSLIDTDLKTVTSDSLKGKNVILLFFPLAFTSVCTAEMCAARDDKQAYESLDAVVIGTSVDSPFVLKKFKEENNLNFTVASDFNRKASRAYDTLFTDDFMGLTEFSKRSAYIIDKEGILRYAETTDGKSLPNFEKIKETLQRL